MMHVRRMILLENKEQPYDMILGPKREVDSKDGKGAYDCRWCKSLICTGLSDKYLHLYGIYVKICSFLVGLVEFSYHFWYQS